MDKCQRISKREYRNRDRGTERHYRHTDMTDRPKMTTEISTTTTKKNSRTENTKENSHGRTGNVRLHSCRIKVKTERDKHIQEDKRQQRKT